MLSSLIWKILSTFAVVSCTCFTKALHPAVDSVPSHELVAQWFIKGDLYSLNPFEKSKKHDKTLVVLS